MTICLKGLWTPLSRLQLQVWECPEDVMSASEWSQPLVRVVLTHTLLDFNPLLPGGLVCFNPLSHEVTHMYGNLIKTILYIETAK